MASVNQTRPHCVNQMGKTYSKPLAARHGRGTAWAQHGNGMLCVNRPLCCLSFTPVRNFVSHIKNAIEVVSENRVNRRIFGPTSEEVKEDSTKFYNYRFHDLYASPDIWVTGSRRMWPVGHEVRMRNRNAHRISGWKPAGKRLLGIPRRRWARNLKWNLQRYGRNPQC